MSDSSTHIKETSLFYKAARLIKYVSLQNGANYNINKTMETFIIRLKSFVWRLGSFVAVSSLAWIGDNIGLLELTPGVTAVLVPILALISGEITKFLNSRTT